MDFDTTTLKRKHRQKITLEIDIFGDEAIERSQVEKIADSFTDFVRQIWCISDPSINFACNSKVTVQPHQPMTHEQVQLPCEKYGDNANPVLAEKLKGQMACELDSIDYSVQFANIQRVVLNIPEPWRTELADAASDLQEAIHNDLGIMRDLTSNQGTEE